MHDEKFTVRSPIPLVPTPAVSVDELRGERVIVGSPGSGWRYDLRADDKVHRGDQVYVPILTEADFYRAEEEGVEVFAPLVPIERVWIEQPGFPENKIIHDIGTVLDRLVRLETPPIRRPMPASEVAGLNGRRLAQSVPDGERRGLRAASEPYEDRGDICLRVCEEDAWYRWSRTGETPRTEKVEIHLLWVE
ncbi:hypothetical protein Afil01_19930 [Actinorhabdospora filicis]|uniref:Uncharacterized protein n=1 Tax=Actinorhabdospora filicis TaxID=1785913 RepID=A0A9W6SM98_9ACTN|nr:hypothetical protein [Actinorhabdospora filicis]GLZ77186.1 hypothetical protein Afil01_19930 [Actinorhabdospora filicis]